MFSANAATVGVATDPYFNYVTALLHGDGANAAQNNTFVDSSSNNFSITRNGNTTQGTFSAYGTLWSNVFDGNGDYLSFADNAAFAVGSGNWTLEAWVYLNSYTGTTAYGFIYDGRPQGVNGYYLTLYHNNGTVRFFTNGNGVINSDTGTIGTIPVGRWTHVAVCKSGNSSKMFLNGSQVGSTYTDNNTYLNGASRPFIGANAITLGDYINGYVSNLRLVKGTALYTSNFTPSAAPLTAVTNTSLLTCQANRLVDASSNNFTVTRNGDVTVSSFSPFLPSIPYLTSVAGGSGYFDGTGDYLSNIGTLSSFNFMHNTTALFTWECWAYFSNAAVDQYLLDNTNGSSSNIGVLIGIETSKLILFMTRGVGGSTVISASSTGTVPSGQWVHLAITYDQSLASNNCKFYINGVASGTATKSANAPSSSNASNLMRVGAYNTGLGPFTGYMSGLRIANSVVYTGAFTPPTAPPTAISTTALLLNYTNGGIFDNSMKNDLETVGNAQISTSVKKFGTGSLYFDRSGDYLAVAPNINFAMGTGDFTIEGWVYFAGANANGNGILQITNGYLNSTETGPAIGVDNGTGYWAVYTTNSGSGASTTTPSVNTWYHFAMVRYSGTTKLYINGSSVYSVADSNNYTNQYLTVGGWYNSSYLLNGYIDDLRITKGVARYTANFTPPTAAFPNQ